MANQFDHILPQVCLILISKYGKITYVTHALIITFIFSFGAFMKKKIE